MKIALIDAKVRNNGCLRAKKFLYLVCTDVRGFKFGLNEPDSGPNTNAVYCKRFIWSPKKN